MRASAFALTMVFLASRVAQAGLYNPAEPGEGKLNPDFKVFRETLFSLRFIRLDKLMNDPLQMRYMMMQQSAPRVIPADWSLAERLSLSAYLIRREKYQEAIDLLEALSRKERDNFLVLANLSTAYYQAGQEPARAYSHLETSLSIWPAKWSGLDPRMKDFLEKIGWDETSFRNYREAETYQLKLIRSRNVEKAKRDKGENLDDLFGVSLAGENGKYEAGKPPKDKLPPRVLSIVQQLLVWSPNDPRLYWLLGEVYNARGDVAAALQIFEELAGFNGTYRPALLANHLNILRAAPREKAPTVTTPEIDSNPPPPNDASTPGRFDVRTLLVGIIVGIALSIFAYWQFREIRRRRTIQQK